MELKQFFGIDFGTTNSATVGITINNGRMSYETYGDLEGNPYPSIVAIHKETGEVLSGLEVRQNREQLAEEYEIITSIKSYLATDRVWEIAGKSWGAKEIASYIFKGLKETVYMKSGLKLDRAMVSVPGGFSADKRKDLREAARIAGIDITGFVSESTAAVFHNYKIINYHKYIAVFDWGGGTLDVSIVENNEGHIYEKSVRSLKLGGDDIDKKIARKLHDTVLKSKQQNILFENMEPAAKDMIIKKSEDMKRKLGTHEMASMIIAKYGELGIAKASMDIDLFEELIKGDIFKAIECLEIAVVEAGLTLPEIGTILMVGGSSNLKPLIYEVEKRWGENYDIRIIDAQDKGWDVATGTAYLAANPGQFKVNQEVGVILSDSSYYRLVENGQSIDEKKKYIFAIVEDSKMARFIFTDGEQRIGNQDIITYGFFQEELISEIFIDENLVLNVEIKSSKRADIYKEVWRYSKLKFGYKLPKQLGV